MMQLFFAKGATSKGVDVGDPRRVGLCVFPVFLLKAPTSVLGIYLMDTVYHVNKCIYINDLRQLHVISLFIKCTYLCLRNQYT